jgi:ABC-type multidrug transport system ATPase subunit
LGDVRKFLGVCPQFDILFDMLTPEEHFEIFCMFKGVDKSDIPGFIQQTMKDVDLVSKSGTFSKNLSGGQK